MLSLVSRCSRTSHTGALNFFWSLVVVVAVTGIVATATTQTHPFLLWTVVGMTVILGLDSFVVQEL